MRALRSPLDAQRPGEITMTPQRYSDMWFTRSASPFGFEPVAFATHDAPLAGEKQLDVTLEANR